MQHNVFFQSADDVNRVCKGSHIKDYGTFGINTPEITSIVTAILFTIATIM
jgi:hypothetical protein